MAAATGHVKLRAGKRGPVYYLKYRLPDGRQIQRRLGPAWTGKGRPPAGHFTRRMAGEALQALLTDARRGQLGATVRVGATFSDAAAEWLRYVEQDRLRKHSTLVGYRSIVAQLDHEFGDQGLDQINTEAIDAYRARLVADGRLSGRTINKYRIALNGIFKRAVKVYGLSHNPVLGVEAQPERHSGNLEVFTPSEVHALTRAADCERNAAVYFTAAFTGLRLGELVALRWSDVDFPRQSIRVRESYTHGQLTSPKSGKVRTVPMVDDVARRLARLGERGYLTDDRDLVFPNDAGDHLDPYTLRRRYQAALKRAGLRRLRFHDLRHTFGTLAIEKASIVQVKEWMGHSKLETTMIYLHHRSRSDDAALLAQAFKAGDRDNFVPDFVPN
jgi:integrase